MTLVVRTLTFSCRDVEKMLEMENVMTEKGLSVQPDTLKALLKGYAKTGNIEEINRTLDRFGQLKMVLLNKDVFDVIFTLQENGHHDMIDAVAQRLYKSIEFPASLNSFIVKVIQKKHDDVIRKLMSIFDEADRVTLAKEYIGALQGATTEQCEEAFKLLESHGITLDSHPAIFSDCLQLNSTKIIWDTLKAMKARAQPIENRHFWKLIKLEGANGTSAVLNVVLSMKKDFGLDIDILTIRDVILPSMNASNDPHMAIARLRTVEPRVHKIARSLFERCLLDKKMNFAYEVLSDFKNHSYNIKYLRKSLIDAFVATDDVEHFAKIVNVLQFGVNNHLKNVRGTSEASKPTAPDASSSSGSDSDEEPSAMQASAQVELIGDLLREAIGRIHNNPKRVESLLRGFLDQNLVISLECADRIRKNYEHKLSQNAFDLLGKLSSGESPPTLLEGNRKRRSDLSMLSSDELGKMIEIHEEKGNNTAPLKKLQFRSYIREKNVSKVNELKSTVELTDANHNDIIEMYHQVGDCSGALNYLVEVRKDHPAFHLKGFLAMRLAQLMYAEKRDWHDILSFIVENKQPTRPTDNMNETETFLRDVSRAGNAAQLSEAHDILFQNNYLVHPVTGLLVTVHLQNNDLAEAVRAFEQQYKAKFSTAGKISLMKALIQANDMEKLQSVFDMVLSRHSESRATLILARAFLEIGNIRQARVVLKNNLLRNENHSIVFRNDCKYLHESGRIGVLEGLLEATEGLEYHRGDIYFYLLLHYCKQNQSSKALELWYKQLDEDEKPSKAFLQKLASHLNENKLEIPFHVPEADPEKLVAEAPRLTNNRIAPKHESVKTPETPRKLTKRTEEVALLKAIEQGNADVALELWKKIDSNSKRYTELTSYLIRLLSNTNRRKEAIDIAVNTLASQKDVYNTVLAAVTQQLAADGDLESLDRLDQALSPNKKHKIQFYRTSLKAYEVTGKWKDFFDRVLAQTENATDETIADVNKRIHIGTLLRQLQNHSILFNECKWTVC